MKKYKQSKCNGKPLSDATEPMTIMVTARDADRGEKKNPMTCALARGAMHDKHIVAAYIGVKTAVIEFKHSATRFDISKEDVKKIHAFDHAGYFQPGACTLVPPKKKLGIHTVGHRKKSKRIGNSAESKYPVHRRSPVRHLQRHPAKAGA